MAPLIIYWHPNNAPTSTAHSSLVQPDCWKPCSSKISFIMVRCTKITAFVLPNAELKRSVKVAASFGLIPRASKSNTAVVFFPSLISAFVSSVRVVFCPNKQVLKRKYKRVGINRRFIVKPSPLFKLTEITRGSSRSTMGRSTYFWVFSLSIFAVF